MRLPTSVLTVCLWGDVKVGDTECDATGLSEGLGRGRENNRGRDKGEQLKIPVIVYFRTRNLLRIELPGKCNKCFVIIIIRF